MTLVVLGASGGTGRELVAQALERNLDVRALVRNPDVAGFEPHPRLTVVRANVTDPASVAVAIEVGDVVVSALGVTSRSEAGTLSAGARAVVDARPTRIVWLGAMGTGPSSAAVSRPIGWLMRKGFGAEYADKVWADTAIVNAGGTVLHSGPLSDKPNDPRVRLEPLESMPKQFFPKGAPRATIARLMLDVATGEESRPGVVVVRV